MAFLNKACVTPSAPGGDTELTQHTQTRAQHVGQDRPGPGPVHYSAVQRLHRAEDVHHGLAVPESTLLSYGHQLAEEERRRRGRVSQNGMREDKMR